MGNIGAADATFHTWFGAEKEYTHGIQWLPFSPYSEILFSRSFVQQEAVEISRILQGEGEIQPLWKGLMLQIQAVVEPQSAWDKLVEMTDLGQGASLSMALYWTATREEDSAFDLEEEATENAQACKERKECIDTSGCRILGLQGDCCPSSDGTRLGCCAVVNL